MVILSHVYHHETNRQIDEFDVSVQKAQKLTQFYGKLFDQFINDYEDTSWQEDFEGDDDIYNEFVEKVITHD